MEIKYLLLAVLILLRVKIELILMYSLFLLYEFIQKNEAFRPTVPEKLDLNNLMGNKLPFQEDIDAKITKFIKENDEKSIKELYYEDVYRPLDDYFDKRTGYRQLYTNNDVSGDFIDSFKNMPSCKENPEYCYPNYDNRYM